MWEIFNNFTLNEIKVHIIQQNKAYCEYDAPNQTVLHLLVSLMSVKLFGEYLETPNEEHQNVNKSKVIPDSVRPCFHVKSYYVIFFLPRNYIVRCE